MSDATIRMMMPVLVLLTAISMSSSAQLYRIGDHWYLGPKAGVVSFFGDLSIHDFDPANKLSEESDLALGFEAGKSLNRLIDIKFNLISGAMKGSNPGMDMYFSNSFSEISIGTAIDITRLVWPMSVSRFHLAAEVACGAIRYRSIKYSLTDDAYLSSVGYTSSREISGPAKSALIFPLGIGAGYRISDRWIASVEFLYRLHNTDLLDSQIGSTGISDRYSYTSFGFSYVLFPVEQPNTKVNECPRW